MDKNTAREIYKELGKSRAILEELHRKLEKSHKKEARKVANMINESEELEAKVFDVFKPKRAITWSEFHRIMCEANNRNQHKVGVIVYRHSNWVKKYSLKSRSYVVGSSEKIFQAGAGGYSVFGGNLDHTDDCVRLERVGWAIEYCYMLD